MNNTLDSHVPEPIKVGVWAEGTHNEAKKLVIPKKSPESSDDIPTIPDLDDLQDILEKDIAVPAIPDISVTETASALAAVRGLGCAVDGIEAAVEALLAYVPQVPEEVSDVVWTVDSLLLTLSVELQQTIEK